MSEHRAGQIVRATAGRDKGGLFCVIGVDERTSHLLLADGRRRKAARPKRKKPGHMRPLTGPEAPYPHPTIQKLNLGEPVTDRELRRALAAFKEGNTLG